LGEGGGGGGVLKTGLVVGVCEKLVDSKINGWWESTLLFSAEVE